jgi:6-phosphogluconolactonase (cycloisomerase 2 family)
MNPDLTMLVGTYTSGGSKGLYSFRFNQDTGKSTALSSAKVENPSYLTLSPDGAFVYTVSELGDDRAAVYAFAFDQLDGTFRLLGSQKTGGADPCYIINTGKYVVTANYSGGSISTFPVAKDGSLLPANAVIKFSGSGADPERQSQPHLHCVRITPDGKYLLADDLGTDQIHKFLLNAKADASNKDSLLTAASPSAFNMAPGSGPRHLIFSADGHHAYLISELSGAVTAFDYNDGQLAELQTIQADTVDARGSADIHLSPDGRFLYASNRLKADGIAIFSVSPGKGTLTKVGYQLTGIHPRNFILTPNGRYLLVACRDSNVIQVFDRNPDTGLLTEKPDAAIALSMPVCIRWVL